MPDSQGFRPGPLSVAPAGAHSTLTFGILRVAPARRGLLHYPSMIVLGWLVALCFWADLLFPPCLAIYALIGWRGGWRIAAAAPLLVAIPAAVSFLNARHSETAADSPSLLWYVPLSLALCAYSATVLLMYFKRKPPKA